MTTPLPAGVPGGQSLRHLKSWTFAQVRQYACVAHLVFRAFLDAPEAVAEKLLTTKVKRTMRRADPELVRCAPRLLELSERLAKAIHLLYDRTATPREVEDVFSSLFELGKNTFGKLIGAPDVHMMRHFHQVAEDYGSAVASATDSGERTKKVMKMTAL